MKTVRLIITGKVQGVWFRASAKEAAINTNINGEVWNTNEGAVEVIAQGEPAQLEKFIEWCQHGPPLARVEHVDIEELDSTIVYPMFDIIRK